ncbi:hypothetical protein BXZ70DRAFT_920680 [Cristinia sonorae]|uniref:Transmembrane protein n=1 Tax=Cristinia sonorae TaxID=1940300 RepID=A0A8K0XTZ0_9AGAR|nr:hypothetical protein BXZ70DRAFT_920680 [Cristinia sonorae]
MEHSALLYLITAVAAASFLPTAHAYCYIDNNGFQRCTLSTPTRVGIGIGLVLLAFGLLFSIMRVMKRRRRVTVTTVHQPAPGPTGYNNSASGYPNYQAGYQPGYPNGPYNPAGPQYPPQTYGGYDATSGFAPPSGPPPPQYTPPAGPPSDMPKPDMPKV